MSDKNKLIGKDVKVDWVYPENLQSHFVSNLIVQHQPDFFICSFFETWPPAILGETNEEIRQQFEHIDHITAKCVARLVLTPSKMKDFVKVISTNLKNYEKEQFQHNLDENE